MTDDHSPEMSHPHVTDMTKEVDVWLAVVDNMDCLPWKVDRVELVIGPSGQQGLWHGPVHRQDLVAVMFHVIQADLGTVHAYQQTRWSTICIP